MAKKKVNPLDFTGLDYDAIRNKIQNELDKDDRFETFRESSIAKTILDMFSATTDITNYYIERRAEEQFLDTARLRSSVIALSRLLGYTPRRPTPAQAGLGIIIKGPLPPTLVAGDTVTFNKLTNDSPTTFIGAELPFGLKYTYTYEFTADDITGGIGNPDFTKEVNFGIALSASNGEIPTDNNGNVDSRLLSNIELIQGELKVETIFGGNNPQVGQLFQKYKIQDKEFSNLYGEEDFGYSDISSDDESLLENLTRVGIGNTQTNAFAETNLFRIRRKSLIDPREINIDLSDVPQVTLMLTNMDEGITLYFGDELFSRKGLNNSSNNIYVRYFATKGAGGNNVGVINTPLVSPNTFLTDNAGLDITGNLEFKFASNSVNGTDLESIDSIRLNAPEIFYSLDRLITKRDYTSYLKTQTVGDSGGVVKNAIAWGEQEEVRRRGQSANFRFFNVIFFSLIGEVYNFISNDYFIKTDTQIHDAQLEEPEDFSTVTETSAGTVTADGYPEQSWFNVLVKGQPQTEILRVEDFRNVSSTHPISQMYDKLEQRSQMTVRPIYISPIIQKFKLEGRVTIGKLEDRNAVRRKINNNIYTFLNDNADFEVNIFKSPITDIIQNETEVVSTDVYFTPVIEERLITDWDSDPDVVNGAMTSASLVSKIDTEINIYLSGAGFANIPSAQAEATSALLSIYDVPELSGATQVVSASTLPSELTTPTGIWTNPYDSLSYPEFWYEYRAHARVGGISEYTFYNTLMKNIYDSLGTGEKDIDNNNFRDSQYFKNIMFKLHNDIVGVIRTLMLDTEGSITNYSLGNEISQVEVDLSYIYD